ncbi:MAG: YdcF family protein, partial [Pseudomonadota bacterium]|nr:YdcF family protein [Pseudomonadota bacterium]
GGTDLADTLRRHLIDPALLGTQTITLGRAATDTVGNAAETAAWAQRYGLRSLIVVTAGYHMVRALDEIDRFIPGLELRPMPVRPPALRSRDDITTLRLLAIEYDKLLAVRFGVTRLKNKGLRL